jgi:hypothetical protein
MAKGMFDRLDQNKDGLLQSGEQRGINPEADANHDGVITPGELQESFANGGVSMRGRGGRRGEERNGGNGNDSEGNGEGGRRGRGRGGRGGDGENNPSNNEEANGNRGGNNREGGNGGGDNQSRREREQAQQAAAARAAAEKKDASTAKTIMSTMAEKSYRFKPAREQMPKEAPSWFTALLARDRNGDGQVDMSEYESRWTESALREFNSRDKDRDGIITLEDAMPGK